SITANLFRGVNCEIEIDEENPYFYYDGGYLIRRDGNEIIYAKDKTQHIPSYVRKIGDFVFYNSEMSELAVPEFIESIGDCAFAYCQNLKKAVLPDGLKNLGASAFACCYKLQEINIPSEITRIEDGLFNSCYVLNVNIPSNVTEIGQESFCYIKIPFVLAKEISVTGYNAFKGTTIYTSNNSADGDHLYRYHSGKINYDWIEDCYIVYNCEFAYDGEMPYVYSWDPYKEVVSGYSFVKDEDGNVIQVPTSTTTYLSFAGYILNDSINFTLLPPQREGYTFKGWTTEEGSDTVVYEDFYVIRWEENGKKFFEFSTAKDRYVKLPEDTAMLYAVWEKNE
ncbi:MAG: leucine-rich repeat domain-containing protein, partial [Clostridia bacterium]|nr:leucine-rich repeat domain-containing protein [Clostridia bacterium]